MNNNYHIAVLPGDGIGPETTRQVYKILNVIKKQFQINIVTTEHKIGGDAINSEGTPFPKSTLKYCEQSNAILFGAVGGPQWTHLKGSESPEQGALLALRKHFNLFANLRPIYLADELKELSPLNINMIPNGIDIIFVRELTGGIYFGQPKGRSGTGLNEYAFDTAVYHRFEIERIANIAFKLAQKRRKRVSSIDKANVLHTSMLWREVVSHLAKNYPDVELEHLYIDNASMQLINNPSKFDIILCPNLFGDILSDECAMISGSIGMLPSASINEHNFGLYEPAGGSAPDIAEKNIANPIAHILSIALLFRYSLKLDHIAIKIEKAVSQALMLGYRTIDIAKKHEKSISTNEMGDIIAALIKNEREK
ncbi:3-isopropylmalate dehydrogenase [Candidatus Blochmanniella pennsylvanica str. BPEN]|uniref:3-isopropylmalate dehydrogenase n=1 Tax=Blochmanniella pennsylvanica (strain BPEN) TaxID=291272 RepID=LEU3_BLOPB|nr:3-isopropylmalate dehydrogenase [Candidatus Blochmannia pennsylvanicus]Q493R1.1 RecName: Full=3-isopropylmalate dehydrogenase; AltName: Full=3-IPM-DH; AltName: Full=Beta-IPM dehydrogenase; Short=IMDH [Candidatus Blochmannia pennsylvanicus str. BPEN]AAZ40776.1 3-isopropylmalate dehydrogenase [Candidatus Blochmannia pennsylvanicus str. BPEN]UOY04555.1 3-isopropylmalate dehydrogenase [Candidatus Blochmannia pennsylvanicus]